MMHSNGVYVGNFDVFDKNGQIVRGTIGELRGHNNVVHGNVGNVTGNFNTIHGIVDEISRGAEHTTVNGTVGVTEGSHTVVRGSLRINWGINTQVTDGGGGNPSGARLGSGPKGTRTAQRTSSPLMFDLTVGKVMITLKDGTLHLKHTDPTSPTPASIRSDGNKLYVECDGCKTDLPLEGRPVNIAGNLFSGNFSISGWMGSNALSCHVYDQQVFSGMSFGSGSRVVHHESTPSFPRSGPFSGGGLPTRTMDNPPMASGSFSGVGLTLRPAGPVVDTITPPKPSSAPMQKANETEGLGECILCSESDRRCFLIAHTQNSTFHDESPVCMDCVKKWRENSRSREECPLCRFKGWKVLPYGEIKI